MLSLVGIAWLVRKHLFQRAVWPSNHWDRKEGGNLLLSAEKTKLFKTNMTLHALCCFPLHIDKHIRAEVMAQEVLEFSRCCYSADSQGQATWKFLTSYPHVIYLSRITWQPHAMTLFSIHKWFNQRSEENTGESDRLRRDALLNNK